MTQDRISNRGWLNGWRIAGWGALLALLALPAIAMQFTAEVRWTGTDFVFATILLCALGGGVELAVRMGKGAWHRAGLIAAALAGFATVWINAAVGIIGEGAINAAFPVMTLIALVASLAMRLRARPMMRVCMAMATGVLAVGLAAEYTSQPDWGPVLFFVAVWSVPALLLHLASRE
ncbi:hypothetical protein [Qipengyuania gaetbuli]|uniref:hypothetical protein n=1 Tax=Qipengyuania gaetbuli TaxID=266952 RepID=UPI001CD2FB49|nr:hypothetical protein [Qipengyuania gaetbuli]MCA0909835.1 hypothetical protein [Qipengyuania gaetbuli]